MAWLSSIEALLAPIVVLSALTTTIFTLRDSSIRRHKQRLSELETTRNALKKHYQALATILESPDVSDDVKMQLILFSEQVTDKESALEIVRDCFGPDAQNARSERSANEVYKEGTRLGEIDPKLSESFATLLASGVIAMFFRWPEGSKLFLEFVRRTISDHQREAEIFARAVNRARRHEGLPSNAVVA